MKISTKGRYALRLMLDLALASPGEPVPLRDVAQRQEISDKYLEQIVTPLSRAGLVRSVRGGLSSIGFKSCDQGRSVFQGTSLDWVWFDEEPPEEIYDECRMRILDRRGDIWGTMTPLLGLTWVHDRIYADTQDPEVWHETMSWADNPFLDERELKVMEQALTPQQRRSRQYGEFASGNGLDTS